MHRRQFLNLLAFSTFGGLLGYGTDRLLHSRYWPDGHQFLNACHSSLSLELFNHEVVLSALEGVDLKQLWDGHVHLLGMGDTDSGCWVNPNFQHASDIRQRLQFMFYLNAACLTPELSQDEGYVTRLQQSAWKNRLLLLAFDFAYNKKGERLLERSAFYTPNHYAAHLHQQFPKQFEWVASIHPYRSDALETLEWAFRQGARGIKWLPAAMGIDLADRQCEPFYQALARLEIPLLCHVGDEQAVQGTAQKEYGNPLLLRHVLDRGVKVVAAHCASLGNSVDLDKGTQGPLVENFGLFQRLMKEQRYEGLLFGDISTMTHIKRVETGLATVLREEGWQARLLYGSDYPLSGIIPLISLKFLVHLGCLNQEQARVLEQLRHVNSLLFDFVLNRHVQVDGHRFAPEVFHTRSFWTGGRFFKIITQEWF